MTGSFEPAGFCWAGFLCLMLAFLKVAGEAHWSWWRVLLPFWVVLGHNILYVAIGFIWLSFADDGAAEEAVVLVQREMESERSVSEYTAIFGRPVCTAQGSGRIEGGS